MGVRFPLPAPNTVKFSLLIKRSFGGAQEFACGLAHGSRPQNGSSSIPPPGTKPCEIQTVNKEVLRLRSGFRLRAGAELHAR